MPAGAKKSLTGGNTLWILGAVCLALGLIILFLFFRIRRLNERVASLCRDNVQRLTPDDVTTIMRQYMRASQQRPPMPEPLHSPPPDEPSRAAEASAESVGEEERVIEEERVVELDDDGQPMQKKVSDASAASDSPDSPEDEADVPSDTDTSTGPSETDSESESAPRSDIDADADPADVIDISQKNEFAARMEQLAADADTTETADVLLSLGSDMSGPESPPMEQSEFAKRMSKHAKKKQKEFVKRSSRKRRHRHKKSE